MLIATLQVAIEAQSNVQKQLAADEAALQKFAGKVINGPTIKASTSGAVAEIRALGLAMRAIKDKNITVTVNTAGSVAQVTALGQAMQAIQNKNLQASAVASSRVAQPGPPAPVFGPITKDQFLAQQAKDELAYAQAGNAALLAADKAANQQRIDTLRANISGRLNAQVAGDKAALAQQQSYAAAWAKSIEDEQRRNGTLRDRFGQLAPPPIAPPTLAQRLSSRSGDLQDAGRRNVMTGSILTAAFTAPLVAAGKAVINFSTDYEKSMRQVAALTDIGAEGVRQLNGQVLQLARDPSNKVGPKALADALYFVGSTGLKGADAMYALRIAAKGASAGLGEANVVADLGTSVINAYGKKASEMGQIIDVVTQAVKVGKGEANQYASAFAKVIPIASQAGVSFEEVAASMATMSRVGLKPSETATALRQILNNLIDPSEKSKKAMLALGTSVDALRVSLREKGLLATLQDLMKRTGGAIGPISELFGNIRGMTGFLATAANQPQAYADALEKMGNATGATDMAVREAGKSFDFQFTRFKNVLASLAIEIGSKTLPSLSALAEVMANKLPSAFQVVSNLPDPLKKLMMGIVGLLALSGPILLFSGTIKLLGSAFLGLGAAFVANPVLTAILTGAAIIGGIAMWNKFRDAVEESERQTRSLSDNALHLDTTFKKALDANSNPKAKQVLENLQTKVNETRDDSSKLDEALKKAFEARREIKELGLAPGAEDVLMAQVNRIIKGIEDRKVHLTVTAEDTVFDKAARGAARLKNGVVDMVQQGATSLSEGGGNKPAALNNLRTRAAAVGLTLPDAPNAFSAWFTDANKAWEDYRKKVKEVAAETLRLEAIQKHQSEEQKRLQEEQNRVVASMKSAYSDTFADRVPRALDTYKNNLRELMKLQDEYNRKRKGGWKPTEADTSAYGDLSTRVNQLRDKLGKEAAAKAADQRVKEAEAQRQALQAQLDREQSARDARIESLRAQEHAWTSYQSLLGSVVTTMGQMGQKQDAFTATTERARVQGELLKHTYDNVPKPFRESAVALAGLLDRMKQLQATQDAMTDFFDTIQSKFVALGLINDPMGAWVRGFERLMGYKGKMEDLAKTMKGVYSGLGTTAQNNVNNAKAEIKQTQKESKDAKSLTPSMMMTPGALGKLAATSDTGIKIAEVAMQRQVSGAAARFDGYCQVLARTSYQKVTHAYDKYFGGSAKESENRFKRASIGMPYSPGMAVAPGGLLYSQTMGSKGKYGHVQTIGPNGERLDQHGVNHFRASNFDWYVPPPGTRNRGTGGGSGSLAPMPVSKLMGGEEKGTPAERLQQFVTGTFTNSLTNISAVNKAWGAAVRDMNGNSVRFFVQSQLGTEKFQNMLKAMSRQTGVSVPEIIKMLRAGASAADAMLNRVTANYRIKDDMKGLERSIRMVGKENNPYAALQEDLRDGDKYGFADKAAKNRVKQTTLQLMDAQAQQATKEFVRGENDKIRVLAMSRDSLLASSKSLAEYERQVALAQMRVAVWNSPEIVTALQMEKSGVRPKGYANSLAKPRIEAAERAYDANADTKATEGETRATLEYTRRMTELNAQRDYLANNAGLPERLIADGLQDVTTWQKAYNDALDNSRGDLEARALADEALLREQNTRAIGREIDAVKGLSQVREESRLVQAASVADGQVYLKYMGNVIEVEKQLQITQYRRQLTKENGGIKDPNEDFKVGLKSEELASQFQNEAIREYASRMEELGRATATAVDPTGRLALEYELLHGKLAALSEVQKDALRSQLELSGAMVRGRQAVEESIGNTESAAKGLALSNTQTAKERLQIEFDYIDAIRQRKGTVIDAESAQLESSQRAQQLAIADLQERQQHLKEFAGQFRDLLSSSINDGMEHGIKSGIRSFLSGIREMVQKAALEQISTRITQRIFGPSSVPNAAPLFGGLGQGGGATASPAAALSSAVFGARPGVGVQPGQAPQGATQPNAGGEASSIFGALGGLFGGGGGSQEIGNAVINVRMATINTMGTAGAGGTGSPTITQMLGGLGGSLFGAMG